MMPYFTFFQYSDYMGIWGIGITHFIIEIRLMSRAQNNKRQQPLKTVVSLKMLSFHL